MARTRDFTCLKHITWTINREYQALWNLPQVRGVSSLKKNGSITSGSIPDVLTSAPPSNVRGSAQGHYKREQEDGAGNTTNAAKSDAVGEEMRVDSFVKDEIEETDGDGLIEKAKKGVKKVGQKMKDASDYMRAGRADKAEEKEGQQSTMRAVMDKGADTADGAGDTVKEVGWRR